MNEIVINPDLRPCRFFSTVVSAPFYEAQFALETQGYRIISLPEIALLRREQPIEHAVSSATWTREGVIYFPTEKHFVRNSPVLKDAIGAANAQERGLEFYPNQDLIDEAMADSFEIPHSDSPITIPTNRLGEDPLAKFIFGLEAKPYGNYLDSIGQKEISLNTLLYAPTDTKTIARQVMTFSGRSMANPSSLYSGRAEKLSTPMPVRGIKNGYEIGRAHV